IDGIALAGSGASEVRDVDGARKRMHVGMMRALRFVEGLSAGEHDVCFSEELTLELAQLRRRASERRELVHAVVYDSTWMQMMRIRQRHRRVVPEHEILHAMRAQRRLQQLALRRLLLFRILHALVEKGHPYLHAAVADSSVERRCIAVILRLLHVEHAALARGAAEEVLRTLKDEIPP